MFAVHFVLMVLAGEAGRMFTRTTDLATRRLNHFTSQWGDTVGWDREPERKTAQGNMNLNSNSIILRTNSGGSRRGFIRATEVHLIWISPHQAERHCIRDGGADGTINLFIGGPYGNVGVGVADRNDNFKFRVLDQDEPAARSPFDGETNTYVGVAAGNKSLHHQRTNDSLRYTPASATA